MKVSRSAPKSSFYGGRRTAVSRTGRFCASSITSVRRRRHREVEDYEIDLDGVTALELRIVPDISGGSARASLAQLRLALDFVAVLPLSRKSSYLATITIFCNFSSVTYMTSIMKWVFGGGD